MNTVKWLLQGPPWTRYRTQRDLLELPESNTDVYRSREEMLAHPLVQGLINETRQWPWPPMKNHKSAKHEIHKLSMLAELGLRKEDTGMKPIIENILQHTAADGPFRLLSNYPKHFGGSGQDEFLWALCDAPLTHYALMRFRLDDPSLLQRSFENLGSLGRENGWPCAACAEMGKFRGPGRKNDPCPYANLLMLKVLGEMPEQHDSPNAKAGVEALLQLWQESRERTAFLFKMGTDFRKLKAPLIWYDILHFADVLSKFHWLHDDPRYIEILNHIREQSDENGLFTPQSIWMAWKSWDFGQKKKPSSWLTFLVYRIFKRSGQELM